MAQAKELTLSQVQEKLSVAQHVLIHLCEKGVIEPDYAETEGRGVWRRFSERNLFEFAVALTLRNYQIPVAVTASVISKLRLFEGHAAKAIKGFKIPGVLNKLNFEAHLYEGKNLFFVVSNPETDKTMITWTGLAGHKSAPKSFKPVKSLPTNYESYLTLHLSQIARRLTAC